MTNPTDRIKHLRARASRRASRPGSSGEVVQLPIWPEPTRGLPNTIARSALFTVRYRNSRRRHLKGHVVAALSGITITYTGEELRQDDETVMLQLLHLARLQPLGEPVTFTPYSFLRSIRWPTSGRNHYDRLAACIDRLNATGINVASRTIRYGGSLVRKFSYMDDETGERLPQWTVWLEPEIIRLFGADDYSRLHWEQRLQLKKPVSQWLHSFYAGHREPHALKVTTIMQLCGSSTRSVSSFRGALRRALDDLVRVGFLVEWRIDDDDLVHVVKADNNY